MERKEPIVIQYGGFAPKYYCNKCKKRVYKKNKICINCLHKNGKINFIDWRKK